MAGESQSNFVPCRQSVEEINSLSEFLRMIPIDSAGDRLMEDISLHSLTRFFDKSQEWLCIIRNIEPFSSDQIRNNADVIRLHSLPMVGGVLHSLSSRRTWFCRPTDKIFEAVCKITHDVLCMELRWFRLLGSGRIPFHASNEIICMLSVMHIPL